MMQFPDTIPNNFGFLRATLSRDSAPMRNTGEVWTSRRSPGHHPQGVFRLHRAHHCSPPQHHHGQHEGHGPRRGKDQGSWKARAESQLRISMLGNMVIAQHSQAKLLNEYFSRSKGVRLSREAAGQQKVHLLRDGQRRRVDGLDWR